MSDAKISKSQFNGQKMAIDDECKVDGCSDFIDIHLSNGQRTDAVNMIMSMAKLYWKSPFMNSFFFATIHREGQNDI